jgi:hypothetical protein
LETSAGTSSGHDWTKIDRRPPEPAVVDKKGDVPLGSCNPHLVPVYGEFPIDETLNMKENTYDFEASLSAAAVIELGT